MLHASPALPLPCIAALWHLEVVLLHAHDEVEEHRNEEGCADQGRANEIVEAAGVFGLDEVQSPEVVAQAPCEGQDGDAGVNDTKCLDCSARGEARRCERRGGLERSSPSRSAHPGSSA